MEQLKKAVIHLKIAESSGLELIKSKINLLASYGKIKKISSVYKKNFKQSNLNSLNAAVLIHTWGEANVLAEKLKNAQLESDIEFQFTLLIFESEVRIHPELTLPSPQLHSDAVVSRCCSEVWGDYRHPFYNKSMNEIAMNIETDPSVEFYMQSKSLLDF